jgi:hypothetical protein
VEWRSLDCALGLFNFATDSKHACGRDTLAQSCVIVKLWKNVCWIFFMHFFHPLHSVSYLLSSVKFLTVSSASEMQINLDLTQQILATMYICICIKRKGSHSFSESLIGRYKNILDLSWFFLVSIIFDLLRLFNTKGKQNEQPINSFR